MDTSSRKRELFVSDERHQTEEAEGRRKHSRYTRIMSYSFFQIDDMPSGSSSPLLVERPFTDDENGTRRHSPRSRVMAR